MNSTPGIGHNNPPNDVVVVRETLSQNNAELIERHHDLLADVDRAPQKIEDEETAQQATDLIKMMNACAKSLYAKRVEAKEPYLTLGRAVDGFFAPLIDELKGAKSKIERVLGSYLQRKADAERRQREEEARLAREEANRLAAEAAAAEAAKMPVMADQKISEAVAAEKQADKAQVEAEVRPAKLASVHGSYGSRSSLRSYKVALINDRASLDLESLRPHFSEAHIQVALNSWMAANWKDDKNPPSLQGASFSLESKAQVR